MTNIDVNFMYVHPISACGVDLTDCQVNKILVLLIIIKNKLMSNSNIKNFFIFILLSYKLLHT